MRVPIAVMRSVLPMRPMSVLSMSVRAAVVEAEVVPRMCVAANRVAARSQLVSDVTAVPRGALAVMHSARVAHAQKRHAGDAGETQKHAEIVNVHGTENTHGRRTSCFIVTEKRAF